VSYTQAEYDQFTRFDSVSYLIESISAKHIAEIGVKEGLLGQEVLRRLGDTIDMYYMVDCWALPNVEACRRMLVEVYRRSLECHNVEVIRMDSCEAAEIFIEGSLDLVFIDANHSFKGVTADIEAWLPKVRSGGILCGHDYERYEAVTKAVDNSFGGKSEVLARLYVSSVV